MIGNIVARRYARALFAIGKEKGLDELEQFGQGLSALAEVIEGAPELLKVFRNPVFSVEDKKAVVDKLLAKIEPAPMVRNFCHLLADKERLGFLPEIEAEFSRLLDAEKGVIRGELVTAVELDDAKQEAVKKQLESQAGSQLILDFSTNDDILGGVVLKVGDKVLDGSLRAQLDILKENIKRGE